MTELEFDPTGRGGDNAQRIMLTGLLITLLVAAAIATAVGGGVILAQRRHKLGSRNQVEALPGAGGDKLLERTIAQLRVGDVLTYQGEDFLVEGVLDYNEDGHHWAAGRMVDAGTTRWVVVGLERAGSFRIRLMDEDRSVDIDGFPPENLVLGETRFTQEKRGTATVTMTGETGMGRPRDDNLKTAERCRWWLYETPGDEVVIVEQWGRDFRVLRGNTIAPGDIDMMPGS